MIKKVTSIRNYPNISNNNDNADKKNKKENKKQEVRESKCKEQGNEYKAVEKGTRIDAYA